MLFNSMKEIRRDRKVLQAFVESYGKEDVLNYINCIGCDDTKSSNRKVRRARGVRPVTEAADPKRPATSVTVVADALVSVARRHGNKLDLSKVGFPKTFNELCREVAHCTNNAPDFVLKSLDRRLRSITSIPAFNEFIGRPEVDEILKTAKVEIEKANNELRKDRNQVSRERRGAAAQRMFKENFDVINLSEYYTWKDMPGENGVVAALAQDMITKFPLLAEDEYANLIYDSLLWVIRTNYEEDPVIAIAANDDYIQACLEGDVVPAQISKCMVDIKCIYAYIVHKSVDGEAAYFAARPCTFGHFLEFPKPNNEENINAERDTDEEI